MSVDYSNDDEFFLEDFDDDEFGIPYISPPSLESLLEDFEPQTKTSLHSNDSSFQPKLYHNVLQGLSTQIFLMGDRVKAGTPTVVTSSSKYIVVGTSHSFILAFDLEEKLQWYCNDATASEQGAVSALAVNSDSTKLLAGYEKGYILMIEATTGNILRRLVDAHAPCTAVLHLKFTSVKNLALCGDSSGCVFSLFFNNRLNVLTWESRCLFSGARGEVCCFEPLLEGFDKKFLTTNVLVALGTLTKMILISIRPQLKILYSQQLPCSPTSLPLISWQMAPHKEGTRPMLVWGRGNEINFGQLVYRNNKKFNVYLTNCVQLPLSVIALRWVGAHYVVALDTDEQLNLLDCRTREVAECFDLGNAEIIYNSAQFKGLAVGGGVSEAFALIGEKACYNSIAGGNNGVYLLGSKAVYILRLRNWPELVEYYVERQKWAEVFRVAVLESFEWNICVELLLNKYLEELKNKSISKESVKEATEYCVKLNTSFVINELWDAVVDEEDMKESYLCAITQSLFRGYRLELTPAIVQNLVSYWEKNDIRLLEDLLLMLDIASLDLHQVLGICKQQKLYSCWISIMTKAVGDYVSPLTEYLLELTPDNEKLGNIMLVYVTSCLSGLAYPQGYIPVSERKKVKFDVLRCLETMHSINAAPDEKTYPYLRALLKFNTRECLNSIRIAFAQQEFKGEMGLLQRQRLVHILLCVVRTPEFTDSQVLNLACFVCRLIILNEISLEDTEEKNVINIVLRQSNSQLSLRDLEEREQIWIDLLKAHKLDKMQDESILECALGANCFRVAEHVYEKKQNYVAIFDCYLKDPQRKNEVFRYISNYIHINERCIRELFITNFKELMSISNVQTAKLVPLEFSDLIQQFTDILEDIPELQYAFLSEIFEYEVSVSHQVAETYLKLICVKNTSFVEQFLSQNYCRVEEALKITKEYKVYSATALLLEQEGEWTEALELILEYETIDKAIDLCVRGSEHLDTNDMQKMWLRLLQNNHNTENAHLRKILHSAALFVSPIQLLELISNVQLGDIKTLLQGVLLDNTSDLQILTSTLKLMNDDLHEGLVRTLSIKGRSIFEQTKSCCHCRKSVNLLNRNNDGLLIWSCGHYAHTFCMEKNKNENICPNCQREAVGSTSSSTKKKDNEIPTSKRLRPDLEGCF